MEMPIKVMVTLFVTIVVGFAVITFSRQIIDKSSSDIGQATIGAKSDEEQQKLIELAILDTQQTIDLVEECYNRNHGVSLERTLCFMVMAKTVDMGMDYNIIKANGEAMTGAVVNVEGLSNTDYAIKIYYDPLGNDEKITLSR
jgi:hypothetical protein